MWSMRSVSIEQNQKRRDKPIKPSHKVSALVYQSSLCLLVDRIASIWVSVVDSIGLISFSLEAELS